MDRFWDKVDMTPTIHQCWVWVACTDTKGYGQFRLDGKMRNAHRVAYEMEVGPIPAGMQLDHICRNRSCVRPDHLEPVTPGENIRRGLSANARKTCCPAGHLYAGENLRVESNGSRACRMCRAERQRVNRSNKKKKENPDATQEA